MSWGFLILLATSLALGWLMLVVYTAWLLTHPARRAYAFAVARNLPGDPSELALADSSGAAPRGLEYSQWTFRSRGADLPVWDVQGLDPRGPTIIMTHGWGDSRVVMLPRLGALASLASRLVLWDLPAHGDAPTGTFTLGLHEHEDLLALIERIGAAPNGIVLFGASLGAGSSIVAASESPARIRAIIAEAPYRIPPVPARRVFRVRSMPTQTNLLPAMALIGLRLGGGLSWALSPDAGGFDRALHAARLPSSIPLLVLHGSDDLVCPVEDGRDIAKAAPRGTIEVVEGAGHNNLWTDPAFAQRCTAAVGRFLRDTILIPPCPTLANSPTLVP